MIREGNILPYKPLIKTIQSSSVRTDELSSTVNELRKKLDWALDEIARADRVIQHSNTMTAEWDRLARQREDLITELKAKVETVTD